MLDARLEYAGLQSVNVETSTDLVYASLHNAITSGALAPGQRLIEARLAERMGVSRAPLREAMQKLAAEGLLENLRRRGVVVAILREADAAEIYGLRTALECWAAREACRRATESELATLTTLVHEMERSSNASNVEVLSGEDVNFHRGICEMAGTGRLLRAWTANLSQIRLLSRQVLGTLYADLHQVPQRHERIIKALYEREPEAAERLVREHIESVAARVLEVMAKRESERSEWPA
jgi:DNA-binding GntR family transcriptional regulator